MTDPVLKAYERCHQIETYLHALKGDGPHPLAGVLEWGNTSFMTGGPLGGFVSAMPDEELFGMVCMSTIQQLVAHEEKTGIATPNDGLIEALTEQHARDTKLSQRMSGIMQHIGLDGTRRIATQLADLADPNPAFPGVRRYVEWVEKGRKGASPQFSMTWELMRGVAEQEVQTRARTLPSALEQVMVKLATAPQRGRE